MRAQNVTEKINIQDRQPRIFFLKNPVLLFMLPSVIVFVLLAIYPTLQALWTSFYKYNLMNPSDRQFIWIENYIQIFTTERFWYALGRSLVYVSVSVLFSLVIGFSIALLLSKIKKFQTLYQVGFIIPLVISPTVAAYNFRFMYNYNFGIINELLDKLGFQRIDFLGNTTTAFWSTLVIDIWQWTPLVIIILLAGIETLPKEPYEAAQVDGAGAIRTFFSVTLPLLKPFILIALLLRLMDSLKVYEYIYLVTSGGPGTSSETLNIYLATVGFSWFEMGQASALGFIVLNFTALLALILVKNTNVFKTGDVR